MKTDGQALQKTRLFFEYALDRTKRVARVSAYFGVVTLILGTIATRRVYGSVEKSALEVGGGLAQLGDVAGPNYDVKLNGETIHVSSTMTDKSVDQVLDQFEKECREHAGGLQEELNALPATVQGQIPPDLKTSGGTGIMTTRDGNRGMVACLARDVDLGYTGTLQALTRFARSGDLADLGKLRYVMAERGAGGRTHVIGVWTEGSFHIGSMFPAAGDCPGSDLPETYRPEGSRRLLTASVDGAPFGVRIYQADGTPDEVLAKYDTGMTALGWRPAHAADQGLGQAGRAFMRGPVDAFVAVQPTQDGKGTMVSFVSMPPR